MSTATQETSGSESKGFVKGVFEPLNAGDYMVRMNRIEERETRNNGLMLSAGFEVVNGPMKGEQGYVYTLTGRRRGNTTFCAEKNTPFQGLAADGAKLALYNLDREGFNIVGFVHDEIICEVPISSAKEKLEVQERIMVESMQLVVPDVKISVESQISECYTK